MAQETIVFALGGNAILQPGQKGTIEEQMANIETACTYIAEIITGSDYRVVITHGNGPQVGNVLLQNEAARDLVQMMPLDVCGAATQGMIGYIIQQTLANILRIAELPHNITTVLTQTIVDKDDPAFKNPNKPVGPFYDDEEARKLRRERGWNLIYDSGRGYRRVVPSPKPIRIQETRIIKNMLNNNEIVIAVGGGGIPVIRDMNRSLRGVDAVIDKDLATSRLAQDIYADILMILTDVEQVMLNYGQPEAKGISHMTAAEAQKYLAEGQFDVGSMKPKVEASIEFVKPGGKKAIITEICKAAAALSGKAGTTITSSKS
jgi:carbamate kinase